MTNLLNQMFCNCDDCLCSSEQEEDSFDNLLDEVEELVVMRDSLNMANLLEEALPELGENEFSFESRRLKLGSLDIWERSIKKDWHFAPRGMSRSAYLWDEKPRKKKQFQFSR